MDRILAGAHNAVRNVYFLLLIFILIAMVAVIIAVKGTRSVDATLLENQKQILSTAETNREILTTLIDCTDPAGECAKRAQANQAEAVGGINAITLAAAVCADAPESTTVTELRNCVQGILEAQTDRDTP